MSFNSLILGKKYSKKDLSELFGNPNISIIRKGVYNVSDSESFFFVDLEKKGKDVDYDIVLKAKSFHPALTQTQGHGV